jgi:hypothetical protein
MHDALASPLNSWIAPITQRDQKSHWSTSLLCVAASELSCREYNVDVNNISASDFKLFYCCRAERSIGFIATLIHFSSDYRILIRNTAISIASAREPDPHLLGTLYSAVPQHKISKDVALNPSRITIPAVCGCKGPWMSRLGSQSCVCRYPERPAYVGNANAPYARKKMVVSSIRRIYLEP